MLAQARCILIDLTLDNKRDKKSEGGGEEENTGSEMAVVMHGVVNK